MYAQLDSPLPGLTAHAMGCVCGPGHCNCGMRGFTQRRIHLGMGGLGDDTIDTTSDLQFGDEPWLAVGPTASPLDPYTSEVTDPANVTSPLDPAIDLPLTPTSDVGSSLASDYPSGIGTEFVLVGADQYMNIQTGQIVPMSVALAVTGATPVSATTLQTTDTEQGVNLTDPTTGTVYNGALTTAAQALNQAGQLVTAAGNLTAQGQALAKAGLLVSPASASSSLSASLASLTSWFSGSTLISGFPNWGVLAGLGVVGVVASSYLSAPRRRKR